MDEIDARVSLYHGLDDRQASCRCQRPRSPRPEGLTILFLANVIDDFRHVIFVFAKFRGIFDQILFFLVFNDGDGGRVIILVKELQPHLDRAARRLDRKRSADYRGASLQYP